MELTSECVEAFRDLGLLPWSSCFVLVCLRDSDPWATHQGSLAPDLAAQLCPLDSVLASGPDFPGNLNPAMSSLDVVPPNLSLKAHGALLRGAPNSCLVRLDLKSVLRPFRRWSFGRPVIKH